MPKKSLVKEISQVLGLPQEELVLKLLTINALLLEKAKKEGVRPEEFFEGCVYVKGQAREHLQGLYGEKWKAELEGFLDNLAKNECRVIKDPFDEALYWIRKQGIEELYGVCGRKEFTVYLDKKLVEEFLKTANTALELGLIKKGYEEDFGKRINQQVKAMLEREIKLLKEKTLRKRLKGRP